mgnify:FL=1
MYKRQELSYRQETDKSKLLEKLSQELHLNIVESQRGGLTLQLTLMSYDKLSGTSVPSKSFPYSKIHMDDEQATLEGFSLKDMLSVLSQLREIPILLHNKPQYVRTHPYDWKLPYYFDESLLKALAQYGFKAEIKRDNYPIFTVIRW